MTREDLELRHVLTVYNSASLLLQLSTLSSDATASREVAEQAMLRFEQARTMLAVIPDETRKGSAGVMWESAIASGLEEVARRLVTLTQTKR